MALLASLWQAQGDGTGSGPSSSGGDGGAGAGGGAALQRDALRAADLLRGALVEWPGSTLFALAQASSRGVAVVHALWEASPSRAIVAQAELLSTYLERAEDALHGLAACADEFAYSSPAEEALLRFMPQRGLRFGWEAAMRLLEADAASDAATPAVEWALVGVLGDVSAPSESQVCVGEQGEGCDASSRGRDGLCRRSRCRLSPSCLGCSPRVSRRLHLPAGTWSRARTGFTAGLFSSGAACRSQGVG